MLSVLQYSEKEASLSSDEPSLMEKLAHHIYSHTLNATVGSCIKTCTLLCHVHYLAVHNRFYEAQDYMLMSHLQESILQSDVQTQVSFLFIGACACQLVGTVERFFFMT